MVPNALVAGPNATIMKKPPLLVTYLAKKLAIAINAPNA
jgi:hypothetical protein